jgi:hydrogenase expression/formation protein HypD
MRYIDEFRDKSHVRTLVNRLEKRAARLQKPVQFMEVCGGHTMAIHRFGLPGLLPADIKLLSGPGCPVCVTPTSYIDRAIELGAEEDTILATFGDLYRVPGSESSLEDCIADPDRIKVVYSPEDALNIARKNPGRRVIFLSIGFETTVPTVAATLMEATQEGIDNFQIMSGHKVMPPALAAIAESPDTTIDGFILPGHVSTIIGMEPYRFLAENHGLACCISGFEPSDILQAILRLVDQVNDRQPAVENAYSRVVRTDGNPKARNIIDMFFQPSNAFWRGMGNIPGSGLVLRDEWSKYDCPPPPASTEPQAPPGCRCADVLRGTISPPECALFGNRCTPESPIGPCMVSSEGSCAAHYKYHYLSDAI